MGLPEPPVPGTGTIASVLAQFPPTSAGRVHAVSHLSARAHVFSAERPPWARHCRSGHEPDRRPGTDDAAYLQDANVEQPGRPAARGIGAIDPGRIPGEADSGG